MFELDLLDFEIDVAFLAIEISQLLLVVVELVVLEDAAARDPGEHPVPAGLDHSAQFLLRKGVRPDKFHVRDPDFLAFGDFERGGASARAFVDAQDILHLGARVARLLVHLLDSLAVREQFSFVQRFTDGRRQLFPELGVLVD